jgi:cell division protease FtsH
VPSIERKKPEENLADKVRSFFSPRDGQKNKNALPPKTHFSIWYFLIAFLLFTYLQQYFFSPKVETIPYSQFKQALIEDNVTKLTIGKGLRDNERKR